jgi:hypothetical protein
MAICGKDGVATFISALADGTPPTTISTIRADNVLMAFIS